MWSARVSYRTSYFRKRHAFTPVSNISSAVAVPLQRKTLTAPHYRLFALADSKPIKPGMLRVENGKSAAIEVELWSLLAQSFGPFVHSIPAPLSIGTIVLGDGSR